MLRAAIWPALLAVLLFGRSPAAFHGADILLNAAATAAFYLLLAALGYSATICMMAALLFAVHPLHVEAVSRMSSGMMTSGITATLAGAATLASLACFAHGHRAVSLLLAAIAFFTTESVVAIPALIFALAFINCPDHRRARTAWSAAYPYMLVATAYVSVRLVFGASPPRVPLLAASSWTVIPAAIAHYLIALFAPWPLAVHYELPGSAAVFVAFAILAVWVHSAMHWESLQSDLILSGLLIVCPLAVPVLSAPGMSPWLQVQDRYAYVATTGACLLVAVLLDRVFSQIAPSQRLMAAACVALVMAGSLASLRQQRIWRDNESLLTHTLEVTPSSKIASLQLAGLLSGSARYDRAEVVYRQALRYRPYDREIIDPLTLMRTLHPDPRRVY